MNRLARLDDAGKIDATFASGFGNDPRFVVRNFLAQPDGKLIVGGTFNLYNGDTRNSIFRLAEADPPSHGALFDYDGDGRSDISVFRPGTGDWYLHGRRKGLQE